MFAYAAQGFAALGDPTRREIFARIAVRPRAVGDLARELPVSRPAVSQHLRVLRDHGFATVRPAGTRRLYAVDPAPLRELDAWLERYRRFWDQRLDALDTELARGRRRQGGEPRHPPHRTTRRQT